MDPVANQLRQVARPGLTTSKGWLPFNRSLFLTYEGIHISKDRYRKWFNQVIMSNYCKDGELRLLEIAHETPDTANNCIHTHVVFRTSKAIRMNDVVNLAWMKMPSVAVAGRYRLPSVAVLENKKDIGSALYILGEEDPECAHLHKQYLCYKSTLNVKIQRARVDKLTPIPEIDGYAIHLDKHPDLKLKHMRFWQARVASLIKEAYRKPCDINFVAITPGCGRSTLIRALKYADSLGVHVVQGLLDGDRILQIASIPETVWNRDTLIANVGHIPVGSAINGMSRLIVSVATGLECRNLWMFCSTYPGGLMAEDPSRWNLYYVHARWDMGVADLLYKIVVKSDIPGKTVTITTTEDPV